MRLAFILLLCVITTSFHDLDRLAADEEAAKYRTGVIDPLVLAVPDKIQSGVFEQPDQYLGRLVDFLTKETASDYIKIKRIHDWITENIAYDNDNEDGPDVQKLLKRKRTTCGGFASLFLEMATLAGFEAVKIKGKSRVTFDSSIQNQWYHAWNGVKINGKWYLVDCTHDGRISYNNASGFSKKSSYQEASSGRGDVQLFIAPEVKIFFHFPDEERYQFLDHPRTWKEFLGAPLVRLNYFRLGLRFLNDGSGFMETEKIPVKGHEYRLSDVSRIGKNIFQISLTAPEKKDVSVFCRIVDGQGRFYDTHSFIYEENGVYHCLFSAPGPGRYTAYISGRLTGEKLFTRAYVFTMDCTNGEGPLLPEDNVFHSYSDLIKKHNIRNIRHNLGGLREDGYFLSLEHPANVSVFSSLWDTAEKKVPGSCDEKAVSLEEGWKQTRFKYTLSNAGSYLIRIKAAINQKPLNWMTLAEVRVTKK